MKKHGRLAGTLLATATVAAGAAITAAHEKHKKSGKGSILLNNYIPGKQFKHHDEKTAHMDDNQSEHDTQAATLRDVDELIDRANAVLSRQQNSKRPIEDLIQFNTSPALRNIDIQQAIEGNPDVINQLFRVIHCSKKDTQNALINAFNYLRYDYLSNELNSKTHAAAIIKKQSFVFDKPSFSSKHSNYKLARDGWVVVSKVRVVKENSLKWVWYKTDFGWIPEEAILITENAHNYDYLKNVAHKIGRSPYATGNQHNTVEGFIE